MSERRGPLTGITVVELAGIGPGPHACMLMADLGAEVIRVDRLGATLIVPPHVDITNRGRRSISVDLKHPDGVDVVLRLIEIADVLVEGFRPGVAERLGLGPDVCAARNPGLVYGRMTGWGQDGPLAQRVGHDINYLGITGALAAIGERGRKPVPPLNLVADFGGGSLYLVIGVLSALLERATSGRGQVIDAAMVDGVSSMMAMHYGTLAMGLWVEERGNNLLDGGAPFYDTYLCSDGGYVAVGPIEGPFFSALISTLGLVDAPQQRDASQWPQLRQLLAAEFATKGRDEWAEVFADVDACVTPVLSLTEARSHPHLAARESIVDLHGLVQPAPAPRLSRTPGAISGPPTLPGADSRAVLAELGFLEADIDGLIATGAVHEG